MSMAKKDFIALADSIRYLNSSYGYDATPKGKAGPVSHVVPVADVLKIVGDFCQQQNGNFKRERWLGYIAGENGPNGGGVR